ncbi:MAG: transcriptional repressor LexA [Acidobacteria bacterium]|nr:transcriptional repressor LexA [Acidobacteriota bacterium]MBV9475314.1 transcriptional repressor LexA [Acidobacteriota bacterium]
MRYLTERQRDILNFIRDFQKERGVAPTHREICDHFGFSSYGTVYKHLSLLQKKGLIRRDWNQKRGVELVEQEPAAQEAPRGARDAEREGVRELPLFGYIAAGRPLAVEISDETIPVPLHLTSRGDNYVLKVRGDSMIDDGILDGDFVIIARRERADNGEMVVANVNGEVTLKRLYQEGDRVRLQPANSMMSPIFASARDVAVQGVVVGLMRRF